MCYSLTRCSCYSGTHTLAVQSLTLLILITHIVATQSRRPLAVQSLAHLLIVAVGAGLSETAVSVLFWTGLFVPCQFCLPAHRYWSPF